MLDRRELFGKLGALGFAGLAMTGCSSVLTRRSRSAQQSGRLDSLRVQLPQLTDYTKDKVPGFAVTAVADGQSWTESIGVRTVGDVTPVDQATTFDLASLTKPVVATLALRLRDQGIIDLDAPLLSHTDYADISGVTEAQKVTARLILSHQSGLPNWRSAKEGGRLEFVSAPGEKHSYSGEGFIWLQVMLETVTGKSLQRLLREEIFDPLGMRRTSLGFDHQRYQSGNHASAHDVQGELIGSGKVKRVADAFKTAGFSLEELDHMAARKGLADTPALKDQFSNHPTNTPSTASGSLVSTSSDYTRFMSIFMNGSAQKILSSESVKEMLTPHAPITRHTASGLGWQLEHTTTGQAFSHSGYNTGYLSYSLGRPDTGTSAVLLTNSDGGYRLRWPVITGITGAGAAGQLA